jgi:hypothetical protein
MDIHLAEAVQFFYQWAVAEEAGRREAVVGASVALAVEAEVLVVEARARAGNRNANARISQQSRAQSDRTSDSRS